MSTEAPRISSDLTTRLRSRLDELARIGADPGGGITRLAYTEEERAAHSEFAGWAAEESWECEVDAAGNSTAIAGQTRPYVLLGSHLDTVRRGGAFDGAAGVVAAIEVARLLSAETKFGTRVVAFAGEEGARFGRPMLGSSAAAGLLDLSAAEELQDAAGVSLRDASASLGLEPTATPAWLSSEVMLYIEIHIEQGRQLELTAARMAIVDSIAGSTRLHLDITGRADHSGATPMNIRTDALAAASEIVLAAERIGREYRSTTATVGRLDVEPNSATTVPGRVSMWIDVRDIDSDHQRLAAQKVIEEAHELAQTRGIKLASRVISHQRPTTLDAWPRIIASEICEEERISYRILSSGAGHDAAVVAQRAPTLLIFIPCAGGVSHAPAESARVEDLALAVELAAAVARRAGALL